MSAQVEILHVDNETIPAERRIMLVRHIPTGYTYRIPVFPELYQPAGTVVLSQSAREEDKRDK